MQRIILLWYPFILV